jgi:predicted RNA-binding protein associated with RNAse of E/G family
MKGVISKIDFEKAYEKVNYSFLSQTLIRFLQKWRTWVIVSCVDTTWEEIKSMMMLVITSKPEKR